MVGYCKWCNPHWDSDACVHCDGTMKNPHTHRWHDGRSIPVTVRDNARCTPTKEWHKRQSRLATGWHDGRPGHTTWWAGDPDIHPDGASGNLHPHDASSNPDSQEPGIPLSPRQHIWQSIHIQMRCLAIQTCTHMACAVMRTRTQTT